MEGEEIILKRPSGVFVLLEDKLHIPVPPEAIIARGSVGQLFEMFQLNGDPESIEEYSNGSIMERNWLVEKTTRNATEVEKSKFMG